MIRSPSYLSIVPLARARARQCEDRTARFDQAVDDVEQGRRLLHLVDHDGASLLVPHDQLAQSFGARLVFALTGGVEKVEPQCVRELLPEPGGLAGAAGSEQEEAVRRQGQETLYYIHFWSNFGVYCSKTTVFCPSQSRDLQRSSRVPPSHDQRVVSTMTWSVDHPVVGSGACCSEPGLSSPGAPVA